MINNLHTPWRITSWSTEQETDPLNLNIYLPPLLVRVSHPLVRRKEELVKCRPIMVVGCEQMCRNPAQFLCSVTDRDVYFGPCHIFSSSPFIWESVPQVLYHQQELIPNTFYFFGGREVTVHIFGGKFHLLNQRLSQCPQLLYCQLKLKLKH